MIYITPFNFWRAVPFEMLFYFSIFLFFSPLCTLGRDFKAIPWKTVIQLLPITYITQAWMNSFLYILSFALYLTIQIFIHQSLYKLQPLEVPLHIHMIFITFYNINNLSFEKCHLFPDHSWDDSAVSALGPHCAPFFPVLIKGCCIFEFLPSFLWQWSLSYLWETEYLVKSFSKV